MSKTTETEVKLYYPDLQSMKTSLEAAGAEMVKPRVLERNIRYENEDSTLTSRGIVIRLREDDRVRFTYKGPILLRNDIMRRFEAEVEVNDLEMMDLILKQMGYSPYLIYEKYRTTYELNECEIVLDELPYGKFIEIEGDFPSIEAMISLLGLDHAQRFPMSYASIFNRVKQHLNLDFRDLTFENFKNINVPESALFTNGTGVSE